MPPIQYLNPPPHPFWDFVANIEDHPFFSAYARPPNADAAPAAAAEPKPADSENEKESAQKTDEKTAEKQATAEDEHEEGAVPASRVGIGESNVEKPGEKPTENPVEGGREMPFRGRGRCGRGEARGEEGGCRRRGGFGGCGRRGGHDGPPAGFEPHHGGPPHEGPMGGPPMGGPPMGGPPMGGPWWARQGPPMGGPWWGRRGPSGPGFGPRHGPPGYHHGPDGGPHGPHGNHGHHGSRSHSPHRHGGPRGGPHRRSGPGGPGGFDLGAFLSKLGNRLGLDLSDAAEGLGLNNGPSNPDADFTPPTDIFDTPTSYILHVSLPGAKKSDIGVDYDGENSTLRIAGVAYRPGMDEELLTYLSVDGRKREVGVFEKSVRLGTRRDPASIDVAGINAKMTDGVLVVTVPKVEVEHKKRDVPISGASSGSPSPARVGGDMEKSALIDTDDFYDAPAPITAAPVIVSTAAAEKEAEYQREVADNRSETMDVEDEVEKLPEYEVMEHDHEHDHHSGSDDEGEYVKINVD